MPRSTIEPAGSPTSGPSPAGGAPRIYQAGWNLRYTTGSLTILFTWLLWGDFAFTFFESIFARFIPLYLKDLHASNTLIGVMTGSFAGLVNILFLPNISQWSDRHRGPWGRRIPFLLVVTPLTVASLVLVGFAPEVSRGLSALLGLPLSSSTTVTLSVLCLSVVSYHFFNMVLVNAYNWLLRDVVPLEVMARFLSWFRIVSTVASFAFLWWVFPHVLTHRRPVFALLGVSYLGAFLLMCLNVKEGAYLNESSEEERPGLAKAFALYFREGLSIPLYRNFFIVWVLTVLASACASPFSTLFARQTLGLTLDEMGKIYAWGAVASALALYPMGWLCDRFSAFRVTLASLACLAGSLVLAFFLVREKAAFLVYTIVTALPGVAWNLGSLAVTMRLFPENKFGQFSSGLNVFGCGAMIAGNYFIGLFMDLTHSRYEMTFLWSAALYALSLWPMLLVYLEWRRRSGPDGDVLTEPPPSGIPTAPSPSSSCPPSTASSRSTTTAGIKNGL